MPRTHGRSAIAICRFLIGYLMTLNLPPRIGIWRLGPVIHSGELAVIVRSQPIDAAGSPRWDYVTKLGLHPAGRQAIDRSIAAGASVGHPNVLPVLDGDVSGEIPYVVSPLLEGRTMGDVLSDGTRKPLPVALWFVRQVSQALAAVHRAGWVHADVKPDNAIVSDNGHVTLIDLGFAHAGALPQSTAFCGTPEYAAPELLANASSGSSASDVFALGRVLWQWLARADASDESVLSPVCELVERMVSEAPQDRPTCSEITASLLRLEIDSLGEHLGPAAGNRAA